MPELVIAYRSTPEDRTAARTVGEVHYRGRTLRAVHISGRPAWRVVGTRITGTLQRCMAWIDGRVSNP